MPPPQKETWEGQRHLCQLLQRGTCQAGKGGLGGQEGRQQETYVFGVFTVLFPMCFTCFFFLFTSTAKAPWQKEGKLGLLHRLLLLLTLKDWSNKPPPFPPHPRPAAEWHSLCPCPGA